MVHCGDRCDCALAIVSRWFRCRHVGQWRLDLAREKERRDTLLLVPIHNFAKFDTIGKS